MSKRNIIHGAFHVDFNNEIERLREEYKRRGIKNLTKIESTALAAKRSREVTWNEKKAVFELMRLRGINARAKI